MTIQEIKAESLAIKNAIESSNSVLVLGHQYPDGDAIGSILGLGIMLREKRKKVICSWPEPFEVPEKYSFLPGMDLLVKPSNVTSEELVFALDCANPERLEEVSGKVLDAPVLVNIDHHPDNTFFGKINVVSPNLSATAEIIYLLAPEIGLSVSREAAICLYTGIVTDTGRFQFGNTTERTLRIASEMVRMGVEPKYVYENVYQSESLNYIHLTGEVMENSVYIEEQELIYGVLTQKALKKWNVRMGETEDLIDNLRTLKGHRIAVLFKEISDGRIRVSLRSNFSFDIGRIARKLGGGGHKAAAGYTSEKRSVEEALEELLKEIREIGRNNHH